MHEMLYAARISLGEGMGTSIHFASIEEKVTLHEKHVVPTP
jgi:hypothetical protein